MHFVETDVIRPDISGLISFLLNCLISPKGKNKKFQPEKC